MSLKAPYNFVPLNATVVRPHWANYISHDLPFEDAQSGHLDIELHTHSPLYVRNGVIKDDPDTEKTRFNHHQNRYFIPGSSLKGMLRSVLEIMSFGRISDKIDDVTLAQRDFSNEDLYPKGTFARDIQCGWMKKVGDKYMLKDCGKPGRITHEALSGIARNATGQTISEYYIRHFDATKANLKTAKSKYSLFFTAISGKEYGFEQDQEAKPGGLSKYICTEPGQKRGRIVCTGQPAKFVPNAGKLKAKHSEFVFFTSHNDFNVVDSQVIKNLQVAFFDGEANESVDWKWRKEQLERSEEIPVFFRRNEQGSIKDMGLSFLYKMAYDHSVKELARQNDEGNEKAPDLADTIFGYVDGQRALKGRVQIGHAFVQGAAEPLALQNDVLSGPKPTYYPTYVRQVGGKYLTYDDENARISGWKRYPIRTDGSVSQNAQKSITKNETNNTKVTSAFIPLKAGATFRFRINYHNLRRDELGALISAITFHNTPGTYHSLGLAKPLGYGKISLTILKQTEEERKNYLRVFEGFMRSEVSNWHLSEQLQELVAMALPKATATETSYMTEPKDFTEARKANEYLKKHSLVYSPAPELTLLLSEIQAKEQKDFYKDEKTHFVDVDSEQVVQDKKKDKAKDLDDLKRNWRAMLSNRREEVKWAEEKADRKAKSQKAVEGGPDFTDVQVPHKDPLDRMNNEMIKYGRGVRDNCTKDALMKFTEGYALEIHYDIIINQFVALYDHLSDKERQKWKQGKVDALKYLKRWIGPEKATEVFNNLP